MLLADAAYNGQLTAVSALIVQALVVMVILALVLLVRHKDE